MVASSPARRGYRARWRRDLPPPSAVKRPSRRLGGAASPPTLLFMGNPLCWLSHSISESMIFPRSTPKQSRLAKSWMSRSKPFAKSTKCYKRSATPLGTTIHTYRASMKLRKTSARNSNYSTCLGECHFKLAGVR